MAQGFKPCATVCWLFSDLLNLYKIILKAGFIELHFCTPATITTEVDRLIDIIEFFTNRFASETSHILDISFKAIHPGGTVLAGQEHPSMTIHANNAVCITPLRALDQEPFVAQSVHRQSLKFIQ